MNALPIKREYEKEIVALAKVEYEKERIKQGGVLPCSMELLSKDLHHALCKEIGYVCWDQETIVGYLLVSSEWEQDSMHYYHIPVVCYGALEEQKEQILSLLLSKLAKAIVTNYDIHMEVKLYAHDITAMKVFALCQFGIQALTGTLELSKLEGTLEPQKITYRELQKSEIVIYETEILELYHQLIHHLQQSPVFYPGLEFTDEVFLSYITEDATRLFVAFIDGKIIGMMDANPDGNSFLTTFNDSYNVGDVIVLVNARRKKIAYHLLLFAANQLRKEGVTRFWVEHGTANLNARGFWDHYFTPIEYTFLREIKHL